MNEQKWTAFYFDGNLFFGLIDSFAMFERLCAAYADDFEKVINAREATYDGTRDEEERKRFPIYGFRIECDGEPLSKFFKRNNMHLGT